MKRGDTVYAKWNNEKCVIIDIENNIVSYRCLGKMQERVFKDTLEVFNECFSLESNHS